MIEQYKSIEIELRTSNILLYNNQRNNLSEITYTSKKHAQNGCQVIFKKNSFGMLASFLKLNDSHVVFKMKKIIQL